MSAALKIDYLKGIAENDLKILQQIYQESLPEVMKHVKRNSGTAEDAKDVFQEGVLVIFRKVKKKELVLTTSFHVYLFNVCKRIWLKKLSSKRNKFVSLEAENEIPFEENFEENFLKTKKWTLFNRKFQLLAEECRKVLQMLFNGRSGKEIARTMGYTEEYAKRKKYKCKISLMEAIKKDPQFKALID